MLVSLLCGFLVDILTFKSFDILKNLRDLATSLLGYLKVESTLDEPCKVRNCYKHMSTFICYILGCFFPAHTRQKEGVKLCCCAHYASLQRENLGYTHAK